MEIANQNSLNITEEKLQELKDLKQENQRILDQIFKEKNELLIERGKFQAYKDETESKIAEDRKLLAREQSNARPSVEVESTVKAESVDLQSEIEQ